MKPFFELSFSICAISLVICEIRFTEVNHASKTGINLFGK